MSQSLIARLLEIAERETVQFPREPARGEERPDAILSPVGGPGIPDDPASDVIGHSRETALEICRLVLDDHVQAERLGFHRVRLGKAPEIINLLICALHVYVRLSMRIPV